MTTITIELCQEDRARLDKILAALEKQGTHNCASCVDTAVRMATGAMEREAAEAAEAAGAAEAAQAGPKIDAHPVDAVAPHGAAEAAGEAEAPKITLDDIQALVVKLAAPSQDPKKPSKRDQVRAIVKEYAERVGLIQEKDFPAVMERLTALAEEG